MNNKSSKSLQDEILRMLRMSNFGSKKPNIQESAISKKILKENFLSDLDDIFGGSAEDNDAGNLDTSGNKAPLSLQMKAAMLCHTLNEFQAMNMGLITPYVPSTKGASARQDPNTFVSKRSIEKVKGAKDDYARVMKFGGDAMKHTPKANWDKEWEKILKARRIPIAVQDDQMQSRPMTPLESKFFSKWWNDKGTISMISTGSGRLSDLGKAQLEFLARVITNKPIDEEESTLFNILGDSGAHYSAIARDLIFKYYSIALIPFIKRLTHRAHTGLNDFQLELFIEKGVLHAIDQLPRFFKPERGNLGSFIIQVVKNNVKNQIAEISTYKLNIDNEVLNYIFSLQPPIPVLSTADPESPNIRKTNYVNVELYKKAGEAGFKSKPIYRYYYDDPNKLIDDLSHDGRAGKIKAGLEKADDDKQSPLAKEYLTFQGKQMFYKSTPPNYAEVASELGYEPTNPYEQYNMFKVDVLPAQAKAAVDSVLDEMIALFAKLTKNDPNAAPESVTTKTYRTFIAENSDLIKDLLYDILNYGSMVEVYNKSWYTKNGNPEAKGRPVQYVVSPDGKKVPVEGYKGRKLTADDTTWVWSSGSLSEEEVKDNIYRTYLPRLIQKYGDRIYKTDKTNMPLGKLLPEIGRELINKLLRGIRQFFGMKLGKGLADDRTKNSDKLDIIMRNYSAAMLGNAMIAEVRKQLKEISLLK